MQDTVGLSQYQLAYFPGSAHLDSPLPVFFSFSRYFSRTDQPPDWNQVTLTEGVKTHEAVKHTAVPELKNPANVGSDTRSRKSHLSYFLSLFIQFQWFVMMIPDIFSHDFAFLFEIRTTG